MLRSLELPSAVLTGDLVKSQMHSQEMIGRALDVIKGIANDHSERTGDFAPKFTRFRGDGWQFAMGNVPQALRVAVLIGASLKGASDLPSTRISIGVGQIDSMGSQTLADASGEAFIVSGRALDWLERKAGSLAISGLGITYLHQIAVELLELRMKLWTSHQAEAAALYLNGPYATGREVATRLGISQQAVSYRLAGADARRIAELLEEWETEFQLIPGGPYA
ncbi:hypothetical protein [Fuscibacter oryzae]|uniref:SatD family (SatD) n=1 Tax=Fuscibacter oryzae TaxID=2803939 RepID=A0A8J7STH8_9RHOB|nr:hypothetical protein [Fuscibacter oryzae]MBL4929211.1 hypothetical protein [Fuscibacter oryzae]